MNALAENKKPLDHFLNLKYPIQIVEEDGTWVASVPDLPGCASFGDSPNEAVEHVQEAKTLWIQGQYRVNANIPEPTDEMEYSGRFVLRIPRALHRTLAYQARQQGVSLNGYATFLLSSRQPLNELLQMVRTTQYCTWKNDAYEYGAVAGALPAANAEFVTIVKKPSDHARWNPKSRGRDKHLLGD